MEPKPVESESRPMTCVVWCSVAGKGKGDGPHGSGAWSWGMGKGQMGSGAWAWATWGMGMGSGAWATWGMGMSAGQVNPVGKAGETNTEIQGSMEARNVSTWCSVVGRGMGAGPQLEAGMGMGQVSPPIRVEMPEKP